MTYHLETWSLKLPHCSHWAHPQRHSSCRNSEPHTQWLSALARIWTLQQEMGKSNSVISLPAQPNRIIITIESWLFGSSQYSLINVIKCKWCKASKFRIRYFFDVNQTKYNLILYTDISEYSNIRLSHRSQVAESRCIRPPRLPAPPRSSPGAAPGWWSPCLWKCYGWWWLGRRLFLKSPPIFIASWI